MFVSAPPVIEHSEHLKRTPYGEYRWWHGERPHTPSLLRQDRSPTVVASRSPR